MRDTITFNKYRYLSCLPDNFSEKELREQFIKQALERGWIPKITGYIQNKDMFGKRNYDRVYGYEAYIGKKQAPIFYKNNIGIINQKIDTIKIANYGRNI